MTSSTKLASTQKSLIRLALIPVLGLALVAVLFWPAKEETPSAAPVTRAPLPVFGVSGQQGPAPQSASSRASAYDWQAARLAAAEHAFNPFGRPAGIENLFQRPSAIAAPVASAPSAAPPTPVAVQAVLQNNGESVALIDGQFVRVGDVLRDGSRIVAITPEEVRFSQ